MNKAAGSTIKGMLSEYIAAEGLSMGVYTGTSRDPQKPSRSLIRNTTR